MLSDFFEEQHPGSKIKTQIVTGYFWKWAKVMISQVRGRGNKIGYIDFFCGPGTYDDGSESTPVQIIKAALSDPEMSQMLVTVFNDGDSTNVAKLQNEINEINGIEKLKFKPEVRNDKVGEEIALEFKKMSIIPSLIFIDPFGYKGLSLDLIASVIKDWGCDCIFFFNYNRINAAINNTFMKDHVDALFGKSTAPLLRHEVKKLNPVEREKLILKYFQDELTKVKGSYSLCFKFYKQESNKTSHFLFFVSKHPLAYKLMKQTMADNCGTRGGIPTYEFNPNKLFKVSQMDLFDNGDNYEIEALAMKLAEVYKGKSTNRKTIFENHNVGTPYIEANYKDALLLLEQMGLIICNPPVDKRRKYNGKPTLGETVTINF